MRRIIVSLIGALMAAPYVHVQAAGHPPSPLVELENMANRDPQSAGLNSEFAELRPNAIREAAETLGIQKAIRWRYEQINAVLEKRSDHLDKLFDFRPLLMQDDKLLPPVITEANDVFSLNSLDEATASQTTFELKSDARIVTAPPSWRDYLIHHFGVNDQLHAALQPKDAVERVIWLEGVRRGWEIGTKQADSLFEANLNRLVRDFRGIVRFHMLAEQRVVSMPTFAEGDLGIRVNGKHLDVGQRIFRITDHSKFNPSGDWKVMDFDRTRKNRP